MSIPLRPVRTNCKSASPTPSGFPAAPALRGIIVHQHGAGTTAAKAGAAAAYDLHWQALAKKWDCALMGGSYHVLNEKIDLSPGGAELWFDPRKGSDRTFLKALGELAVKSGRPELATVPWCLWGHSGGGIWSDVMSTLHPDRVVAVWLRSGSAAMFRSKPEFPPVEAPAAVYQIPTMSNPGVKEKTKGPWTGTLATFQEYRARAHRSASRPTPSPDTNAATAATSPYHSLMPASPCACRTPGARSKLSSRWT